MDGLNFTAILDLLDPTKVVNDVVVGLILAIFGIIAGIVVFKYKWKKAEEKQQKEKLGQENDKELIYNWLYNKTKKLGHKSYPLQI